MARTQSADYDRRKQAIVETAISLFAKRGFLGTSVADIAQACRTSKALVYHYFSSKEDVLYAAMSAHLDDLLAVAEAESATTGSEAETRLRNLTLAFLRAYAGAAHAQKILLNELDNLPPDRAADIVARQRRIVALVSAEVSAACPRLDPAELIPLTMLYFGMINWAHTWFRPDGAVSVDRLAALAADMFLAGLAAQG